VGGERENNKGKSSIGNQNSNHQNFFDAPHHLYFHFKIVGNLEAIKTIKEVCKNANLESLSFACTGIDDAVIETIIQSFIQNENSSLKELNLSGNHFTDEGISRLLNAIEQKEKSKLQNLNLRGNPNVSEGVLNRAETIIQKRKLSLINLS